MSKDALFQLELAEQRLHAFGWRKGHLFMDGKFCLLGAVGISSRRQDQEVIEALIYGIYGTTKKRFRRWRVTQFNDNYQTTFQDIMAIIARAKDYLKRSDNCAPDISRVQASEQRTIVQVNGQVLAPDFNQRALDADIVWTHHRRPQPDTITNLEERQGHLVNLSR